MRGTDKGKGMNSKYIQFFVIAAVFMGFMFFTSGGGSGARVYMFRGYEGGFVELHNAMIIAPDHELRFFPGILIADNLESASGVSVEFFFSDGDGNIRSIYRSVTYMPSGAEADARTMWLPLSQAPINIREFILEIDNIIDSLRCEVVITFTDGTVREATFYLNVMDVLAEYIDR